jgi:tetratricopeptide (TPR) repeat protein
MMKRFPTFLAVLFVLAIVCHNNTVSAKDMWISIRSKNFVLVGNAGEKDLKRVGARLEQFREVFSRLFPKTNFNSPVPTTVIVFKSDSSYRPFKPNANTAGYFQAGTDVNYITLTTEVRGEQDPFNVIFHEYTHLLVNNNVENPPDWFNEGLAEYYSTFSITDDQKVELGRPIASHVYLLRENKLLPLRTLFQVDHKSPYYNERNKQSIFYAQSWALMHYLILGKDGQRLVQIGKFLDLMNAKVPMEQAFQQAFQTTFEVMEKELREYIKQDRYHFMSGHFERKLELDAEMKSTPISEAEAQAYLGDLLLHSNRAESEGYLQKALVLDPELPMANASMGMLRVREGKTDEARKSLERAASANSQNYLIHYYFAYALSREGMGDSPPVTGFKPETVVKIRDELKKAIQLRPDFPESYTLLAFVSLVTGTQLDESVALLKRALATSPGRNDFTFMLAQLYLHKEEYKFARQLLEQLNNPNVDEATREHAQTLLIQMASMEEQKARYEGMNTPTSSQRKSPSSVSINVDTSEPKTAQTPSDPSSYLQEVLRKPAAGETQLQATLVRIDCAKKAITFVIKAGDRLLRLRTDSFDHVEITTYSPDVAGEITCGPRKPENMVVVCFVPSTDTKASDTRTKTGDTPATARLRGADAGAKPDGTIRSLEFVPKDFKLIQPPVKSPL